MRYYVDSDGVLADFNGWVRKYDPSKINSIEGVDILMGQNCKSCFIDCEEMPNAKDFFDLLKRNDNWFVLTALPRKERMSKHNPNLDMDYVIKTLEENKYKWFEKRGIPRNKVIISYSSSDKVKFCNRGDVLYDDRELNVERWNNAGGFGVLIKS